LDFYSLSESGGSVQVLLTTYPQSNVQLVPQRALACLTAIPEIAKSLTLNLWMNILA